MLVLLFESDAIILLFQKLPDNLQIYPEKEYVSLIKKK
jgi:hypothetical protein